ncbi:phospholipid carrier-dependent glycosyltransferase [soil metagenome]
MPAPANIRPQARRKGRFRWQAGLILVAAAIVYLVGNESVGLWDRDEPRYAQTSRQMLQSGDWVVPHYLSDIRTAKPIFIYWCQASAMKIFSDTAFAARLPSVLAMLLTLAFLTLVLPPQIGRRRTALTMFILATSALAMAAAKMCLTDAVLLLWVTIAQACLFAIIHRRGTWPTWIVLGIAVGFAGLTKGPVIVGVMGTTIVVLIALWWNDRRLQRHRSEAANAPRAVSGAEDSNGLIRDVASGKTVAPGFLLALAIVAAICVPWLILIHQRAPEFLPRIIGHDVVARMSSGLEGHKGPPGYYLLTIWGTYFPWSLFLPAAIVYGWTHRRNPLTRFALASVVGPWIMFEIFQTKLVHYMLPTFPPLALLTAMALATESARLRRQRKLRLPRSPGDSIFLAVIFCWCGFVGLVTLALMLFTILKLPSSFALTAAAVSIALIGAEMARATFVAWRARRPFYAAGAMGVGMLILVGVLYGAWIPNISALHTSQRVAATLRAERATTPGSVIMIDYKEPSLAFYQGGTIREESNNSFLRQTDPLLWPKWIVMTRRIWDDQPASIRERLDVVDFVPGWWYANKGRSVEVLIVRKR